MSTTCERCVGEVWVKRVVPLDFSAQDAFGDGATGRHDQERNRKMRPYLEVPHVRAREARRHDLLEEADRQRLASQVPDSLRPHVRDAILAHLAWPGVQIPEMRNVWSRNQQERHGVLG